MIRYATLVALLFLTTGCCFDWGGGGGDTGGGGGDTLLALNESLDEYMIDVDYENCKPGTVMFYSRSGEKIDACDKERSYPITTHVVLPPKMIRELYDLLQKVNMIDSSSFSINDKLTPADKLRLNMSRRMFSIYWGIYRGAEDIRARYTEGKPYPILED